MIVDDITVHISGGKGGNGVVSFRREKFIPKGGPDGGNGGKGGDVYMEAVDDLTALRYFTSHKNIQADNGEAGKAKKMHGADADDLVVKVPIGTTVKDLHSEEEWYFETRGQKECIARGGRGGRGNWEFRSNENKVPREFEEGRPGQARELQLNLSYIADIGLIGLPSAGKSSLLNALTKAEAKVGDYPFTTLEPNLGVLYGTVIADIPGLIEGAHQGKGLGDRFLKHIEKTRMLLHCIDVGSEDIVKDYSAIRSELGSFNPELLQKEEVIILTKSDTVDKDILDTQKKKLQQFEKEILTVSVINDDELKNLQDYIVTSEPTT